MPRSIRRTATAIASAGALTLLSAGAALAHGDRPVQPVSFGEHVGALLDTPVASGNVTLVDTVPAPNAVSGMFSLSTEHFYVSTLHEVRVLDISDPAHPVTQGILQSDQFENEAMNYGEQRLPDGTLEQFVLIGVDTHQGSATDPDHVNLLGPNELVIVDVSDPNTPKIRSRVEVPDSTHTVTCVRQTNCKWVYSAGSRQAGTSGENAVYTFSVISLADLDAPKVVGSFASPALDENPGIGRAGHKWNFDETGHGFHTGSGGTAIFDVTRPAHPQLLTTTNEKGKTAPWNNFIHHNSWHPRSQSFRAGTAPSLANGNVVLVTEEDYEQVDCSLAGSFQTWHLRGFYKQMVPLDKLELADLGGPTEGITPVGAFCSAHWFDFHPKGITAVAYYGGGVRFVDTRNPRDLKSYGYAYTPGSQVWDAYWVPKRNDPHHALKKKTNISYAVDFTRGVDVYRVALPQRR